MWVLVKNQKPQTGVRFIRRAVGAGATSRVMRDRNFRFDRGCCVATRCRLRVRLDLRRDVTRRMRTQSQQGSQLIQQTNLLLNRHCVNERLCQLSCRINC